MEQEAPKRNGESVLEVSGLHRSLGEGSRRVDVLRGLNLKIQPGRVYSVVGPSGCGKSTLLYILGLLDQPDAGQIWLHGSDLAHASDERRTRARNEAIGFVFQFHYLMGEFRADENVMLPMRKRGLWGEKEMRERSRELLTEVGLGDKVFRFANQLSGGEQQRVAVARALANYPSLILADEPTGNLDEKNSRQVFDMFQRFSREKGLAIVIVTHNQDLARLCDHTLPMRDGVFVDEEI